MRGVVKYVGVVGVAIVLAVIAFMATRSLGGSTGPSSTATTTSRTSVTNPAATPGKPQSSGTQSSATSPTQTPGAPYARAAKRAYRSALSGMQPKPLWRVYVSGFSSPAPGHVVVHTTLGSKSQLNAEFAAHACRFVAARAASISPALHSVVVRAGDGVTLSRCGPAPAT